MYTQNWFNYSLPGLFLLSFIIIHSKLIENYMFWLIGYVVWKKETNSIFWSTILAMIIFFLYEKES